MDTMGSALFTVTPHFWRNLKWRLRAPLTKELRCLLGIKRAYSLKWLHNSTPFLGHTRRTAVGDFLASGKCTAFTKAWNILLSQNYFSELATEVSTGFYKGAFKS